MAADGQNVHGEADFVMSYKPKSVLDAGCGMGRVGIELANRGVVVTGVDLDPEMLDRAIARAPEAEWIVGDLADLDLGREFDVVAMAGNVVPFVRPEDQAKVITALCRHVAPEGVLISGSSLWPHWPGVSDYDQWCDANDFELVERFAAWTREPFETDGADYVVSVYRRP